MTAKITMNRRLEYAAAALALMLLQGCATGPSANPADPLEPFNRTVFNFNDGVDRAIIKPVATAYQDVTPELVRRGVTNFFGNISDLWSLVNNVLQFKPAASGETLLRVGINTFWGLGGVLDVASEMKIGKHTMDFGQTMGYWGVASGPYLVLPLLGPSSVRDSIGTLVDMQGNLVNRVDDVPVRNSLIGLRAINTRARLLGVGDVLEQAALDKYSFARDIYLQRRRNSIGGAVAPTEERFDLPEAAPGVGEPAAPASAAQ